MAEKKLQDLRRDFALKTSCHGLAEVQASTNRIQKIFWIVLTLVVFVALIIQVAIRIKEYAEHNTTTSVFEKYVNSLEMPAITICNFNKFFDVTSKVEKEAIDELAKARNSLDPTSIDLEKIKYFEGVYNGSIKAYAIDKGWQLDKDLILCLAGEDECTHANFSFTLSNMGKCWTFETSKRVFRAGSSDGVAMLFDVRQDRYSENLFYGNWEAGVRVQVHPSYDVPQVEQLGMAVPVGSMAYIGVRKREESIMYKPWGDCEPDKENLDLHDTYSSPNCFDNCFQRLTEESCGCHIYYADGSPQFPECSPRNMTHCFANVTVQLRRFLTPTKCECSPPCKSLYYDTKISYATLPNTAVRNELLSVADNITKEYARDNLVGIAVYYEKMSYTTQRESEAISPSALISDLGGQLGLWVGISVVTLFEIAQFVIQACANGVTVRRRTKKRMNDQTMKQPS